MHATSSRPCFVLGRAHRVGSIARSSLRYAGAARASSVTVRDRNLRGRRSDYRSAGKASSERDRMLSFRVD